MNRMWQRRRVRVGTLLFSGNPLYGLGLRYRF
jgi:hypothetical protein